MWTKELCRVQHYIILYPSNELKLRLVHCKLAWEAFSHLWIPAEDLGLLHQYKGYFITHSNGNI